MNIALLKKCKAVDVPAVNLQSVMYRKHYRNTWGSGELMEKAQAWCLDTEELYNKAEVHSINNSKGDAADVGIFSDNSQVMVFEFLESAELAYLVWGNSIQKVNKLYNKHLSNEIKSHIINISDNYSLM